MPIIKESASDFTSFVRAGATLPTTGKVVKTTTTSSLKIASAIKASVLTASKVAVKASPSTVILSTKQVNNGKH